MESGVIQEKSLPSRGLKQVKVDNWGIFFLQRLQQLYYEESLLDIKIKFPTSDITVKVQVTITFTLFYKKIILSMFCICYTSSSSG